MTYNVFGGTLNLTRLSLAIVGAQPFSVALWFQRCCVIKRVYYYAEK